jgi:hypothetical protein
LGSSLAGKRVARAGDLAVNGAPPAFREPLHVGRPNIPDPAAYQARIAEMLDRRWLTNDGPMVRAFEARLTPSSA